MTTEVMFPGTGEVEVARGLKLRHVDVEEKIAEPHVVKELGRDQRFKADFPPFEAGFITAEEYSPHLAAHLEFCVPDRDRDLTDGTSDRYDCGLMRNEELGDGEDVDEKRTGYVRGFSDFVQDGFMEQVPLDVVQVLFAKLFEIITVNLFRTLPSTIFTNDRFDVTFGEPETDDLRPNPKWEHHKALYELLLVLVTFEPSWQTENDYSLVIEELLTDDFLRSLLYLTGCEDYNERDMLKIVIHRIYGRYMNLRPKFRLSVQDLLANFNVETRLSSSDRLNFGQPERQSVLGISELLEIFSSIAPGFVEPVKEEHLTYFRRTIMPLHKLPSLSIFHKHLVSCVARYIKRQPNLAPVVINLLLQWWPRRETKRQVLFLSELKDLVELVESFPTKQKPGLDDKLQKRLVGKICESLRSAKYQVVERTISLIRSPAVISLINRCLAGTAVAQLKTALNTSKDNHWSQLARRICCEALDVLEDQDMPR